MIKMMREGVQSAVIKVFLFGLMTMAVAGLVLTDVGGFFRGGVAPTSVAKVAGHDISRLDFEQQVNRALQQQAMLTPEIAYQYGIIDNLLNQQISGILLQRAAYDAGLIVDDSLVAARVSKLLAPYVSDTMTAKEAFRRLLMSQNMSEAEFAGYMRNDLASNILRAALSGPGKIVNPQDVSDLYQFSNEQRTIDYVLLPDAKVGGVAEPDDDILMSFYQAGKERYAVPALRKITVATLSRETIAEKFDIAEEELRAYYDSHTAEFTDSEKRVLQQALLDSEEAARDVASAAAESKDLKKAVKKATGNNKAYIGEESFAREGLLEDIAKPAFDLEPGQVSAPVKTGLGWHVLLLKDIKPASQKPFDAVRKQIREDLLRDKLDEHAVTTANMIDDALAGGETLDAVSKEMGMTLKSYGPLREDGSTAENKDGFSGFEKDRDSLLQTAFSLGEGESSPVQELSNGDYAVVRADSIKEKTYKSFEDVRADLAKTWTQDQQSVLNRQNAEDLRRAVEAGKETLENPATATLSRSGEVPKPFDENIRAAVFAVEKTGVPAAVPLEGAQIVFVVKEIKLPDVATMDAKKKEELEQGLKQTGAEEVAGLYIEDLRRRHGVRVNRPLLDQLYLRTDENPVR